MEKPRLGSQKEKKFSIGGTPRAHSLCRLVAAAAALHLESVSWPSDEVPQTFSYRNPNMLEFAPLHHGIEVRLN